MADTLIDKLDELDRRFEEIFGQMNNPAVAADGQKIVALSKEHASLAKIVIPYRKFRQLAKNCDEAQAIQNDPAADAELKELAETEVAELRLAVNNALEEVKGLLVMSEEQEIGSVIMEIRAGTGGDEAALFAGDLLDMYRHYAEQRGWKTEIMDASPTEMGGFKEVVVNIKGESVWSRLGYEGGGHRVQRVPKTENQGRIHTSAATVAVLPEPEELDIQIDWEKDVLEHVSRAGGPGGQNVNKVSSAIKLEHLPTGITVSMRDEKSQHKNRAKARQILTARVYEHFRSQQASAESAARKEMIGSGDRSQRIRTYNFPQNRCTDHRLKGEGQEGANFNLERVLAGDLDPIVDALIAHDKAQRLANL
ncbi:MAG TPA: peptide chain release factor 1 [Phycisphaerae bacterium]|nr:peptide chain release factor 1 [Phycisphaerae bacterium]HPS52191.1 peptide chain release factor 1 [Phycisphaerae bacterium]